MSTRTATDSKNSSRYSQQLENLYGDREQNLTNLQKFRDFVRDYDAPENLRSRLKEALVEKALVIVEISEKIQSTLKKLQLNGSPAADHLCKSHYFLKNIESLENNHVDDAELAAYDMAREVESTTHEMLKTCLTKKSVQPSHKVAEAQHQQEPPDKEADPPQEFKRLIRELLDIHSSLQKHMHMLHSAPFELYCLYFYTPTHLKHTTL